MADDRKGRDGQVSKCADCHCDGLVVDHDEDAGAVGMTALMASAHTGGEAVCEDCEAERAAPRVWGYECVAMFGGKPGGRVRGLFASREEARLACTAGCARTKRVRALRMPDGSLRYNCDVYHTLLL